MIEPVAEIGFVELVAGRLECLVHFSTFHFDINQLLLLQIQKHLDYA